MTRAATLPGTKRPGRTTGPSLALVGPTASGKSEAAITLGPRLGAEVLVIDSMTIYRGMDVGTAKPSPEQRAVLRHHLLDLADPTEPFSVARFQAAARQALADVGTRGVRALLVGGSGLHFRAVVDGLAFPGTDPAVRRLLAAEGRAVGPGAMHRRLAGSDPAAAARIEPGNLRRTIRALEVAAITGRPFSSFAGDWGHYPDGRVVAAGVDVPAGVLRGRIEARIEGMLADGLIEEVRGLLDRGLAGFLTSSQAIGYREVALFLEGRVSEGEMVERMNRRTRNLARRQVAWFRRDPRIRWFPTGSGGAMDAVEEIEGYLRG